MGGGGSRPAPQPTIVEEDPPAGSGESSIIYPNRAGTPRLDGLTRSMANECDGCNLQVTMGITSSSIKLSREFGEVTDLQCKKYKDDKKRVTDKKMSFQDFLGNVKAGKYLRNLDNGYCEQITISDEDSKKYKTISDFEESKLQSVRIQKVSSGGFSSDTKVKLTPSIPFKLTFKGQEIDVKTMTVYHPCPLRIEGVQPDAVFSLNDPSFDDKSEYIVLIPLTAKNTADPSIALFDKILPQINALMVPEATGQYMTRNVATGANWSLASIFTPSTRNGDSFEVKNGYYEWKGMPTLERAKHTVYSWTGESTISYSWKESGKPSPRYIMLDTPVAISSSSLSSITQTLPVTPSTDAVHAVLYNSDPLRRGIVHKQGPPNPGCERESFADMNGVKEDFCDDWTAWAQDTKPSGYTTQQIFGFIFNALIFVAMAIGAYLAFAAILRLYDIELKNVSAGLGKITAVVFKSLKQKAGEMKGMTSGLGGLGGLLALSRGKPISPDQIAKLQANPAALAPDQIAKIQQANPDIKALSEGKPISQEQIAKLQAKPDTLVADKAAADKSAADKATADKAAADKAAADKAAADKAAADKSAADKVAADKVAADKSAADKAVADKAAADKAVADKAVADKAAADKAAADKAAADKAAADKAAADKAADKAVADKKKRDEQLAEVALQTKQRNEAKAADKAAEAAKKVEEVKPTKKVSSSIAERQRNFSGTSFAPTKENAYKLGTLKKGQGRTKPGHGRVGSTRRAGY
jgi:Histone H1-like nucleoprotein HC2